MKKILIIFLSVFLLFSCGSSDNKSDKSVIVKKAGLRLYEWKDFSMRIPAAWNLLTDNNEVVPQPVSWKLELAISSVDTKNWFANSLVILSQNLDKEISSKDYSVINNVWAENDYLNYFKKQAKDFVFSDWEKSIIYNFDAKYSADAPLIQYIQTAHICNWKKAFLLTLWIPLKVKDISKYEKMLATFKCK